MKTLWKKLINLFAYAEETAIIYALKFSGYMTFDTEMSEEEILKKQEWLKKEEEEWIDLKDNYEYR